MRIDLVEDLGYILDIAPTSFEELKTKASYKIGFRR